MQNARQMTHKLKKAREPVDKAVRERSLITIGTQSDETNNNASAQKTS